jgi:signal transduction histidine kinase
MDTTKPDPTHTEILETTEAVQRVPVQKLKGKQSRQALWTHLRHELRTPLDAIISYSELLLGDANGLG